MLTSSVMKSLDRSAFSAGGGQMHQHQLDAEIVGAALDLGKAVGRRRIDAGDELEVEHQISGIPDAARSSALTCW